jgi:hypothetical protein
MKKLSFLFATISIFASKLSAQNFYDRSTIQTIEIFFSATNWDAQLDNLASTTEGYLLADSVRINGTMFDSVGVKYKGNSSYNANNNKNPLHINLDYVHSKADYQGYTNIKLQNGYQDPSMIREVLSYAVLEQFMDCPKANFANVYINGSLRGLYSSAESINDKFNADHYYYETGAFFKCNPVGGAGPGGSNVSPDLKYLGQDSSLYANGYELQSNNGWNKLRNLTDTLNNTFTEIEKVLDVDRALWMLAFNNVLVNLDSYSGAFRQNYYLYYDLNNRFVPTVWDLNMSFSGFPGGTGSGTTTPSTLDPMSNSTSANHPLIVKMMANPLYKRMYMAHARTIVKDIFESGQYVTTANALRTTIDAAVQADPYKFYTYTQFQNSLTTAVSGGGGGPGGGSSIPGIQQLMTARVAYFNTNANYTLVAPVISAHAVSNTAPNYGTTVSFTATCSNETTVYFGYRFEKQLKFNRVAMVDDGLHGDGAAGDHVYGTLLTLNCTEVQYYIYAENVNAGLFSPQRAEHEYHTLLINAPLATSGQVLINEILADNSYIDDAYGESDDWIELYNTTNNALTVGGLYLSDDIANLTKFQIPAGTVIAPNGVLPIWTDDDADQLTGIHTNFKLSIAGESVILSNGTTPYDQVDFIAQTTNVAYARCNDGGTFTFAQPTFNTLNNCHLSVNELLDFDLTIYPVPSATNFTIVSNEMESFELNVFDLQGRDIQHVTIQNGTNELQAQIWESGVYQLVITAKSGSSKVITVVKE